MKKLGLTTLALSLGFYLVFSCWVSGALAQEKEGEPITLNYITAPIKYGNYSISVGQAKVVNEKSNIRLVVQPASGSLAISGLVGTKEVDIGLSVAQTLYDAYKGIEQFSGKKKQTFIRTLQVGNRLRFGIITDTKTGIKSIPDIKGKRYSCDVITSNVGKRVGQLMIKAYGLELSDVKVMKAETNSAALRDLAMGKTDAVPASLSGSKIVELATKVSPILLPFDHARFGVFEKEMPAVFPAFSVKVGFIPAGIPVVGTAAVLFTSKDLPEETAYRLVKVLVENQDALIPLNRNFKEWGPKDAVEKMPIPYHPGAIKYYKEAGLWSAEMDALQTRLLKEQE